MKPIYLDYNATTPIDLEVAEVIKPYLEEFFGNPSSSHWYGIRAKKAIEIARSQVADLLGCQPDEIIFTSGGSESNNYAIKGVAFANRIKGNHIITSASEHPAVTEVCKYLETKGFRVTYLPVDEYGLVDIVKFQETITPQTILISLMHANNEVGTIQPIPNISELARQNGVIIHTDAAQSVGKIPTRVNELGIDLLSVAGHKLYAPKGIGALFIRKGTNLEKLIHGAGHERNKRAGTENVLGIVGLGKACEIAKRDLKKNMAHMESMRDSLYLGLQELLGEIRLNGHREKCLPNTLSVGFPNIEADKLLLKIKGVAASAGAACHSEHASISHVLTAMNVPEKYAIGTIRFSTGKMTTSVEIDRAIEIIAEGIQTLNLK
ncbi:MAG: aminotransferase class V-fold PLP-dependent enzyme [Deltaproteobacteria bacterium]|nr:aminotransferase class V-fold PLP-dependent enzyme [Deltaproteobacteria bacterium]